MAKTFWLGFRALDERLPAAGVASSSCCLFFIRCMLPYDRGSRVLLAEVLYSKALLP